jgi:hypothetical protein
MSFVVQEAKTTLKILQKNLRAAQKSQRVSTRRFLDIQKWKPLYSRLEVRRAIKDLKESQAVVWNMEDNVRAATLSLKKSKKIARDKHVNVDC